MYDDVSILDGFICETDGRSIGCALWNEEDGNGELVIILTTYRGVGAGIALLDAVVAHARESGWQRLWLVTTNDNSHALRWYQRRGFVLAALRRDAVTVARQTLKPEIPLVGLDAIPIRDELELELARHDACDVQQIVDELCLPFGAGVDRLAGALTPLVVESAVPQHVCPAQDGVERRAQLV